MTDWKFDLDASKQRLITSIAGQPIGSLDAAAVDTVINELGKLREQMVPGQPEKARGAQLVLAVRSPSFNAGLDGFFNQPMLEIRDPRFGWLHFFWDRQTTRYLGTTLLRIADQTASEILPREPH